MAQLSSCFVTRSRRLGRLPRSLPRPRLGQRNGRIGATRGPRWIENEGSKKEELQDNEDHLAALLSAMQRQDPGQTSRSFIAWTKLLGDRNLKRHSEAVRQAQELPATTLSEMVRSLDPVANPGLDVAHGLNITSAMAQFTSAFTLVDEFGVRKHHRQVLAGMSALHKARKAVFPTDCEVMMRCAGAGVNPRQVKRFWGAPTRLGLQQYRSPKTWLEFVRGRFKTEPMYYQYDRARIAVLPRDLQRSGSRRMPEKILQYLDSLRLSRNVTQFEPWNRQHWRPEQDWRRYMRHTGRDFRSYGAHFRRAICYPTTIDEEFLCVSMVAFARSSDHRAIREEILNYHYGINFIPIQEAPGLRPSGGHDIPSDSLIKPTARLLDALVEAFGAMSDTLLGLELVRFVSNRYGVPIPAHTWSNLFNWTYVCCTKPLRQMRRFFDHGEMGATSMREVSHVWNLMCSPPYNIEPSFDDWLCWTRALINSRAFESAVDAISDHLVPHFRAVDDEYRTAVLEELLANEDSTSRPSTCASHRRLQAQTRKDHARTSIAHCLHQLLKTASRTARHRSGSVMHCLIPNLVRDFPDFFPAEFSYRSSQGLIHLARPDAPRRFRWVKAWRTGLPARYSASYIPPEQESRNLPDRKWPEIQDMRILGWHRVPTVRAESLICPLPRRRRADGAVDKGEARDWFAWHRGLRRELML
ncbi:hypothetical protein XA68_14288 [Ophiocordyceps unilateralis]|uniref:Uncharacterized protein n=1 Tax=Ophiocordyceps unilateralis TaxID=268505 RepID=A0A2A9PN15_OPHUN|nr:hypothetical protein XA68_14288 [Ophiocordyceps unilateralis]